MAVVYKVVKKVIRRRMEEEKTKSVEDTDGTTTRLEFVSIEYGIYFYHVFILENL